MQLIVETGNSTIKFAEFEKNKLVNLYKFSIDEIQGNNIYRSEYEKAIWAGSGTMHPEIWEQIRSHKKLIFHPSMISNLKTSYLHPEKLGQDRWINAYYSVRLFPHIPRLIIDLGTCFTFTFVDADNDIKGGSISPGLRLRAKSLHDYTARLPLVDIRPYEELIGNHTEGSILSGIFLGSLYEIQARIGQYKSLNPDLSIIMTGGDTHFFENKINCEIFADSHFTLKGLNDLLNTL